MPRKLMTQEELVNLIFRLNPEQVPENRHASLFSVHELPTLALNCAVHLFVKQYKETSDVNRFRKQLEFYLKHGKFKTEESMNEGSI